MAEATAIDLPGPDAGTTGGDHRAGESAACFICGSKRNLAEIFGKHMCKNRVPCYQRWLGKR